MYWIYMMTSSNGNIFRVTGVTGIHGPPVNFPHKCQWRGALMFSFICGWVNTRVAGHLRLHRAHYDVKVMYVSIIWAIIGLGEGMCLSRTKSLSDRLTNWLTSACVRVLTHLPTKWLLFCRRHFHMHFSDGRDSYFDYDFIEVYS